MFLIVVDAHSKWPEVIEMTSTTSSKTVGDIRQLFARYRLPVQIVTDNGTQFVAEKFNQSPVPMASLRGLSNAAV